MGSSSLFFRLYTVLALGTWCKFDWLISVACSDTVTRSGMFCAMATVIDRCKTEGVVDVFQVVKALRVQKPGAVPTVVS